MAPRKLPRKATSSPETPLVGEQVTEAKSEASMMIDSHEKPALVAETDKPAGRRAPRGCGRNAKTAKVQPEVETGVQDTISIDAPAVLDTKPAAPKAGRKPRAQKRAMSPETGNLTEPSSSEAPATPDAAPRPRVTNPQLIIQTAMERGQAVELIWPEGDGNPSRTFEPRQLIFDVFTQAWFAWGWDRRYNADRHHRLDALQNVNIVEGLGRAAQGPFPDGTPANQIGGWRGGETIAVKATLMKQWVYAVRQAPAPFPDFKMTDAEDGKAIVSFSATDLRAIARWCMQFGDGIQIQEPQRLVDRLKQVALSWGGKNVVPTPVPPAQVQVQVQVQAPLDRSDITPDRTERESDTTEVASVDGHQPVPSRFRHERPERNDRGERPERHDHRRHEGRPERTERPERTDRPERFAERKDLSKEEGSKKTTKVEIRFERL